MRAVLKLEVLSIHAVGLSVLRIRSFSVQFSGIFYVPFFFSWRYNPRWGLYFIALYRALGSSLTRFHDHIRRATVGRTPLNE